MDQPLICDTCGNEVTEIQSVECPFCGRGPIDTRGLGNRSPKSSTRRVRTVNLKRNRPTVNEALQHLEQQLSGSRSKSACVLKLIHGYGSSGKGGQIRTAVRKSLAVHAKSGRIEMWIPGEEFGRGYPETAQVVRRFEWLKEDSDYGARNAGVTLVFMK